MKLARTFVHLAFPYEGNNFKAKILHPSGFFLLKLFLIGFQLVIQFLIISPYPKILGYASSIPASEVIRLTNLKRQEEGLPPLTENSVLTQAAQEKGKHMIDNDYWAHVSPDGTDPWHFFLTHGYRYRYAGENLARDFSNPSAAIEAWLASPSHKENMLSPKYREIGIGVVEGDMAGVDTTIIVQFFGTQYREEAAIAQAPTIATPAPTQAPTQTPAPIVSPTPSEAPFVLESAPLALITPSASPQSQVRVLISPFTTTKGISVALVLTLLTILILDAFVTGRRRIRRIGGRSFAHIAFLGMILAVVLILKGGNIL